MTTRIQVRRDIAADWTAQNPVLASGEPGLETDTGFMKMGDGVTAWNSLPYATSAKRMTNYSTSVTIAATDQVCAFDTTLDALTATMPSAASVQGQVFTITNAGDNALTVTPPSGDIGGYTSIVLACQYDTISLMSNGTKFFVIGAA